LEAVDDTGEDRTEDFLAEADRVGEDDRPPLEKRTSTERHTPPVTINIPRIHRFLFKVVTVLAHMFEGLVKRQHRAVFGPSFGMTLTASHVDMGLVQRKSGLSIMIERKRLPGHRREMTFVATGLTRFAQLPTVDIPMAR
jgi:hypothetical protein